MKWASARLAPRVDVVKSVSVRKVMLGMFQIGFVDDVNIVDGC